MSSSGLIRSQVPRRVAVIGGSRIPFARADGPYATCSNQDLLTAALGGLVERHGLHGERAIGEVVAGAVLKHSRDFNLARESVLSTGLDPRTPAYDIQQACATSLQAVIAVANKIALGQIDSGIAGGADTTSDPPIAMNDRLRRILLATRRAKTLRARTREIAPVRPKHLLPEIPRNAEPCTGRSMGEHAAQTAKEWGITRLEQDELAARSHRNLATAYDSGFLHDLVVPFNGLARDQNLRPGTSVQKLGELEPVFGVTEGEVTGEATMTPGNSTPLSDGAATVLLAGEEWARERGLRPLAYLTAYETGAVDFTEDAGEGLLMAPAFAVPRMLRRVGLGMEDFELVEIHEAFASQVLATMAAWEKQGLAPVDRSRLNTAGSSLATGHPFAATGARIVATLAKLLAEREGARPGARGLISICAAGGQGVTAILERA
ncbi:acetyl-CoA C-acetyltransferase [Streptomyces armeniacus]|uniref:Acetyl-CoA C-acetyltransferase n=1 Tax=Streptomyces armeniacus TaxID=83291 RepID=A0A345XN46_9ACTN|nr:acetyl-CoA C-acetyltransferase [Streptomyces armeniacus]AXK33062.1 acetyl-CoA C-acetyltransferase [Streptomyces armeniacus]